MSLSVWYIFCIWVMKYFNNSIMISKFHRVHISIEIFTKEYIFLTSYMHWKFQFIHSKIVDQKKKLNIV